MSYLGDKTKVKFKGNCLKQNEITYTHRAIISTYIVYEINKSFNIRSYPALENCLFSTVSLTKNDEIDKYKYSGYGIGFDRHWFFPQPSGGTGRNAIIFGVDMSSSTKIDNRKKDILILGKHSTHLLEHDLQKKCIQLILLKIMENSVWNWIIMGQTVIYLLMV